MNDKLATLQNRDVELAVDRVGRENSIHRADRPMDAILNEWFDVRVDLLSEIERQPRVGEHFENAFEEWRHDVMKVVIHRDSVHEIGSVDRNSLVLHRENKIVRAVRMRNHLLALVQKDRTFQRVSHTENVDLNVVARERIRRTPKSFEKNRRVQIGLLDGEHRLLIVQVRNNRGTDRSQDSRLQPRFSLELKLLEGEVKLLGSELQLLDFASKNGKIEIVLVDCEDSLEFLASKIIDLEVDFFLGNRRLEHASMQRFLQVVLRVDVGGCVRINGQPVKLLRMIAADVMKISMEIQRSFFRIRFRRG